MCGIFGYLGKKGSDSPVNICIKGLKSLEYRGYDSAGLAGVEDGKITTYKTKGRVADLETLLALSKPKIQNVIGHTRWATHGEPSDKNAHPHTDEKSKLAIVHNGIIENFLEIKERLILSGVKFVSETDTEVIAHLVSLYDQKDLLDAFCKALKELHGTFAIALIHQDYPSQIFASAKNAPLLLAWSDEYEEIFLSSDPSALEQQNLKMTYLKDNTIAHVKQGGICLYNLERKKEEIVEESFEYEKSHSDKGIFEHFMLKEIFEQPECIKKALQSRINELIGMPYFEELTIPLQDLASVSEVIFIGCGTSYHAGLMAAKLLQEVARIPSRAEIASEFRYSTPLLDETTLVVAISQSGETADTLAAIQEVKKHHAKIIGICNVKHSMLTREADCALFLHAGPEISVCSTKAFTSQLTVLFLLTILLGRLKDLSQKEGEKLLYEIKKLPVVVEGVLSLYSSIESLAKKYSSYKNFFFIGRQSMYITALEASLKLKEISYVNSLAYPAGELKHGPIALIDENLPTIALCGDDKTFSKTLANIMEIKARKGVVIAFAHEKNSDLEKICDSVFYLPKSEQYFCSTVYSVALQLFAYFIAKQKGTDIDKPRKLAKSVTVE